MFMWNVEIYQDLESVKIIWKQLYKATPNAGPFMTWEYASLWWQYFGTSYSPLILVARNPLQSDQQVMLPLMKKGHKLRWFATPGAEYVHLLHNTIEGVASAMTAFAQQLGQYHWLKLSLTYLPSEDAQYVAQGLKQYSARILEETGCPYIEIRGRTWDEYIKSLSHSRRENMRAVHRKLEKAGLSFHTEFVSDPQMFKQLYPTVRALTLAGTIEDKHQQVEGKQSDFLFDLCVDYMSRGWLTLALLYIEENPVSYVICFTMNKVTAYWRVVFDRNYTQYSVGKLLLYYLIKFSFDRGDRLFDFMHGVQSYKLHWTETIMPLSYIIMDRSVLVTKLRHQIGTLRATLSSALTK